MFPSNLIEAVNLLVDVCEELTDIEYPYTCITDKTNLAIFKIGMSTLGQGELLEFNHLIKKYFGVSFSKDEIQNVTNPGTLTLREIAQSLLKKLENSPEQSAA